LKRIQPASSAGAARSGLAMQTLLLVLDLVGTFVFALSGGMAGVNRRLDIFGVLVLAFVAANTGGIARDLLIGAVPPAAVMAAVLGMLTGIGGGVMRDMLLAEIPVVLRAELYAVAALAGAAIVVIGEGLGLPSAAVVVAGIGLCFGLRVLAIRRGWNLPIARPPA